MGSCPGGWGVVLVDNCRIGELSLWGNCPGEKHPVGLIRVGVIRRGMSSYHLKRGHEFRTSISLTMEYPSRRFTITARRCHTLFGVG